MSSNDAPTITVDYAGNKRQRWLGSLGTVRGSLGRHDGTTQNFQKNSQRKSKEGANIEFPFRPQWQPLNIPLSRAWENIRAWLVVTGGHPLTNPLESTFREDTSHPGWDIASRTLDKALPGQKWVQDPLPVSLYKEEKWVEEICLLEQS